MTNLRKLMSFFFNVFCCCCCELEYDEGMAKVTLRAAVSTVLLSCVNQTCRDGTARTTNNNSET